MDKSKDFAGDLAELHASIDVSDVLTALKQTQRTAPSRPTPVAQQKPEATAIAVRNAPPKPPRIQSPPPRAQEKITLQNVTTKLPPATKELLCDAALHQRLKRLSPDTEQGIINDALQAWFKRHGYGRRLKSEEKNADDADTMAEPTTDEP